ncbi:MAG: glycosyltransferase family 4 protein [Candidatus Omnitrophica bacterium]|nr:glycosyltransferase family 4 protein [Candidatus Omnitrophota bacterium]
MADYHRKVVFVTRECAQMPGVRVRGHGFAAALRQAGIAAAVFSFADDLRAKHGRAERQLTAADCARLNAQAFCRLVRRRPAAIVLQRLHYHVFGPWLAAQCRGVPLIFDLDDWEAREGALYNRYGIPQSGVVLGIRMVAAQSRACVAASRFLYSFLRNFQKNTLYIPTAVDPALFKPAAQVGHGGRPLVVSWIGTMHRPDNVENIKFLIAAFQDARQRQPSLRLEIRGDGLYGGSVREYVAGLGIPEISVLPWIAPAEMPAYLNSIDIGVMPLIQRSRFNRAKSPTRLFEYMALEKPVIAGACGEALSILEHGRTGFLARTRQQFSGLLCELSAQPRLRESVGRAARAAVCRRYALPQAAAPLVETMRRLAQRQ